MQSRFLVLIIFGIWCIISWRWYVCGVKQVCGTETAEAASPQAVSPVPVPDTLGVEQASEPATEAPVTPKQEPRPEPEPTAKKPESQPVKPEKKAAKPESQPVKPEKQAAKPEKPPAVRPATLPKPPAGLTGTPANFDRIQIESSKDGIVIRYPTNASRREDIEALAGYISKLAEYLLESRKSATITGHTDMIGEPAANLASGLQRANDIRKTLIAKGVAANRISCRSKGEGQPVGTNDTPLGRYKNRRVEIRFNP